MQKKFLINIFIIIIVNIAIKPLWIFGIDRNVQLTLGDATYGLYAALINVSIVFNILLDMGLTNLNNKLVAEDSTLLQENLLNMAVVKLLLFVFYIFTLIIFGIFLNYNSSTLYLLWSIGVIQFLNSFLTFLRSNISANQQFKTDSILSIADKLIMIIIVGFIFLNKTWLPTFTINTFIYCQIIAYLAIIIIALFFTKKLLNNKLQFSWQKLFPVIKQTAPYAILIFMMGIYMRSDLFLLERWLPDGAYQSGQYIKSFRLLDAFNMIGFLFAGMLLPMFAKQLSKQINITPLATTSAKLLLPASVAISIFCCFYTPQILQLIYHTSDAQLVLSFRLVIAVFPAMCIMNIYSTLLTSAGKIKTLIFITSIGALLSITFNYFSIAFFKNYIGVCIVAVFIQYGVNLAYIYSCVHQFGLAVISPVLKYIFTSVALYLALNILLNYFSVALIPAIILNAILFVPIFYWLGFFNFSELKQYFNDKLS